MARVCTEQRALLQFCLVLLLLKRGCRSIVALAKNSRNTNSVSWLSLRCVLSRIAG
jgi:hypothetical protein